ncbi:MAG: MarR family transcriptional regulator [Candidatus Acidiferrales bacterium]
MGEIFELSDLRKHLGFWLRFVSNHVSHAFAAKLQQTGVTVAEWVILRQMYDEVAVAPSAIAEATKLTRGAVSKLVDRLLAKQLLTREVRTDDRRYQSVALTPAGRRVVPKLAALADQNDSEFFSSLTTRERRALVDMLKKLAKANHLYKIPIE